MTHSAPSTPLAERPTSVALGSLPAWGTLGILFGVVSAVSIVLWGPIGVSGTYPRFVGAMLRIFDPAYAASNPYLVKMGALFKPETFLVIGLVIGGLIAARTDTRGKAPAYERVHAMETSNAARYRDAFLGGVLIVFGARLAGGCTSGHIISGITQLSLSGMVFGAAVFATGIFTAKLIRKGA
jgi:uncharacterized membrane protein YedE/YeeE